jgi:glyoxylase-like metal-dependent hydrolase (beta-lactamase superfamily II)
MITELPHPPPKPGQAIEIAQGVFWLRFALPMALDHVNVYALRGDEGWTIIDTGLKTKHTLTLWQKVIDTVLQGAPIANIIITHHHPDHVGLAGWFQAKGADLWMTRTAWLTARMLILDEHATPPPQMAEFWQSAGMDRAMFEHRMQTRPFNLADMAAPLPLGFRRLYQGQIIAMGGRNWVVHLGQGHAPDHATFWSQDDDLVIGGDQFLATISPNLGVFATEPDADPVAEWFESCAWFKTVAQDHHIVLPGHKQPFQGLPDRLDQLIDNHIGALDRLRDHLAVAPHTAVDCFPILFKRQVDHSTYSFALAEAVAHLNHLYHLNEATRHRRADGAWVWALR